METTDSVNLILFSFCDLIYATSAKATFFLSRRKRRKKSFSYCFSFYLHLSRSGLSTEYSLQHGWVLFLGGIWTNPSGRILPEKQRCRERADWWLTHSCVYLHKWFAAAAAVGRWDVLFLSANLRAAFFPPGFLLLLSESSKSPELVMRGRAPRASKHFPALVLNFFQSVPGPWAAPLPLPSASLGFCFSGMAASILEVGNVIVSRFFFFLYLLIQIQLLWCECSWIKYLLLELIIHLRRNSTWGNVTSLIWRYLTREKIIINLCHNRKTQTVSCTIRKKVRVSDLKCFKDEQLIEFVSLYHKTNVSTSADLKRLRLRCLLGVSIPKQAKSTLIL